MKLKEGEPRPTSGEQLQRWVAGDAVCPNQHGECCPDFGCCQPDLLQPPEVRRAFADASEEGRINLLGAFLGAAMEKLAPGKRVHLAGRGEPE